MPPQVAESVRHVREMLSRQPRIVVAAGALFLLTAGWLLYAPPLAAIRRERARWLGLKNELGEARRIVDPVRRGEIPLLAGADAIPGVLEELSAAARSKQVQFLQLSPASPRPGSSPGLVVLPVEVTMEGSYRSWGEFLGALPGSPSLGGAVVRQISIEREERLLPRLKGRVSLEIFLRGAEGGS